MRYRIVVDINERYGLLGYSHTRAFEVEADGKDEAISTMQPVIDAWVASITPSCIVEEK